jgi:hypothetical protein
MPVGTIASRAIRWLPPPAKKQATDKVAALAARRLKDFAAETAKIPGVQITIGDHTASGALSTAAAELGAPAASQGGSGFFGTVTQGLGRRLFFLKRDAQTLFAPGSAAAERAAAGTRLQVVGTAVEQWGQPAAQWTVNELRNLGETIPEKVAAERNTARATAKSANSTEADLEAAGQKKRQIPDAVHDGRNSLRSTLAAGRQGRSVCRVGRLLRL